LFKFTECMQGTQVKVSRFFDLLYGYNLIKWTFLGMEGTHGVRKFYWGFPMILSATFSLLR
jgi:hypothetical protein